MYYYPVLNIEENEIIAKKEVQRVKKESMQTCAHLKQLFIFEVFTLLYAAMITKHHRTVRGHRSEHSGMGRERGVERIKGKENERNESINATNQRMDECMSIIATAL